MRGDGFVSGHYDEGHTVAGWAGFALATAGSGAVGAGIAVWWPGIWLGLVVLVAAPLVTWGLHLAGWGKAPLPRRSPEQRRLTVRDTAARDGHPDCFGCRLAGRDGGRAPDAGGS
ncbi:HGxxPAAW family protein [Streptomyces sp. NPDC003691]